MSLGLDEALLSRIEDAGLNASAPPQQRWLDGWLVRFSPGKAKRARCINAVAQGRTPLADKLNWCRPFYAAAGLPLYVRVTPFSQPALLDAELAGLGMVHEDDTRVMVTGALSAPADTPLPPGHRIEILGHGAFAGLVGGFRGSSSAECSAHAQRLAQSPVPFQAYALVDPDGAAVACGQAAAEAELVGLYDIYTVPNARGRGLASALCGRILGDALDRGARVAYLQVDAKNENARRIYRRLGFGDAYAYHYRTPPPGSGIAPGLRG